MHEVLAAQLNTALAQILTSLGEGEDLARQRLHAELKLLAVELAASLDEVAHEQMRQAFVAKLARELGTSVPRGKRPALSGFRVSY